MSDPYKKTYILKRIEKEGSFADKYPERALDWDYDDERNMPYKPSDFLSGSNKLVYWRCHVCGYKSDTPRTIISHAKAMFPCEQCAIKGRTNQRYGEEPITKTNPELLQEWDYEKNEKDGILPENITNHDTKTQVHWACKRGHHWRKTVSYRLHSTSGKCPRCQKEMQTSFPEQALYLYFSSQIECVNGFPLENNSHIDIFIPSLMVGIEYDGPNHESPNQKARDEKKNELLEQLGIKLYRVIHAESCRVEGNVIYVAYDSKDYSYLDFAIDNLCQLIGISRNPFNIEENKNTIYENLYTKEKENSIAKQHPHLLDEWDYEKNGNIDPECVSSGSSSIKINWKCKNGHSWPAPPSSRTQGNGCPYCSNKKVLTGFNDMATLRPDLLEEWDFEENNKIGIYPDKITTGYRARRVSWICKNNPEHKWETTVVSRTSGTGCKHCAEEQRKITKRQTYVKKNGSFADNHKELLKEWYYEKNDKIGVFPDEIPNNYRDQEVWWKCSTCEHIWSTTPANRAKGSGCPQCYDNNKSNIQRKAALKKNGSLAQNNPEVAAFFDTSNNNGLTADDVTSQCHDKVNWKCPKCNHQWPKPIYKMTLYPCCPKCKYSLNEEKRPILQYDLNLNFIARFDSVKDASEATGIERSCILSTTRHDNKSTKGYVFVYEDDTTDLNLYKPTHQPTPKAVLQYSLDGKLLNEWKSISEAEKACPKAKGKISAVCKGSRNKAGGYVWKYKDSK